MSCSTYVSYKPSRLLIFKWARASSCVKQTQFHGAQSSPRFQRGSLRAEKSRAEFFAFSELVLVYSLQFFADITLTEYRMTMPNNFDNFTNVFFLYDKSVRCKRCTFSFVPLNATQYCPIQGHIDRWNL